MAIIAPAVPFGFDSGLPDTEDELFPLSLLEEMTTETQLGHLLETWAFDSPSDRYSASSFAGSDAIKSPGGQSQQHSNAGFSSSRSPGSASLILTPTSTIPDSFGDVRAIESRERNDLLTSPETTTGYHEDEDYVFVPHLNDRAEIGWYMENRPPTVSASGLGYPNSGVSSSPLHHSLDDGASSSLPTHQPQWQYPSASTDATGAAMDFRHNGQSGQLNMPASFTFNDEPTTQGLTSQLLSEYTTFDDAGSNLLFDAKLPFQAVNQELHAPCDYAHYPPQANVQPQNIHGQVTAYSHPMYQQALPQASCPIDHQQTFQAVNRPTLSGVTHTHQYNQPSYHVSQAQQAQVKHQQSHQQDIQVQVPYTVQVRTRPLQQLQPAIHGSTNTAAIAQNDLGRRKGGRPRGGRLNDGARGRSHKMRQLGACWRCVLQRDPCPDNGSPCKRCLDSHTKARQPYFFACDRTKLGDLVFDFLPPSMTLMHTKQTIEDCVKDQVACWDTTNAIDVDLTSGYGPPLRWTLYEFKPKTEELLGQFQYRQVTGESHRVYKYSPPLGLMKIDTSDDAHFETYMDRLLNPQLIADDFGYTFYEEETHMGYDFQAQLLDFMCALYAQTQECEELHTLLRSILRMLLLTYIMGHTLTLDENTAPGVLSAIRHSDHPFGHTFVPHTSPRLANRQLKFFFSVLRDKVYHDLLHWQQQILHASGKKDATWLSTFCVMLGFAMVLEEVQRTIYIQADAKAAKGETSLAMAEFEAANACERIDMRFELLVGLFQCKYRDRKWGARGSFGNQTPELVDPRERYFLERVRELVIEKQDHLKSRKDVTLAPENQCRFTTRLVSRFLLPFISLPA